MNSQKQDRHAELLDKAQAEMMELQTKMQRLELMIEMMKAKKQVQKPQSPLEYLKNYEGAKA